MTTRVVNIMKDSFDVYIGRRANGRFGNPYVLGELCDRCKFVHRKRESTLPCFKAYFLERVERDLEFRLHVLRLRDKTLGCHCKPDACHGEIIAEWIDQQERP